MNSSNNNAKNEYANYNSYVKKIQKAQKYKEESNILRGSYLFQQNINVGTRRL